MNMNPGQAINLYDKRSEIASGQKNWCLSSKRAAARRIEAALEAVYREGRHTTRDVGGSAETNEFTDAVIAALKPA